MLFMCFNGFSSYPLSCSEWCFTRHFDCSRAALKAFGPEAILLQGDEVVKGFSSSFKENLLQPIFLGDKKKKRGGPRHAIRGVPSVGCSKLRCDAVLERKGPGIQGSSNLAEYLTEPEHMFGV